MSLDSMPFDNDSIPSDTDSLRLLISNLTIRMSNGDKEKKMLKFQEGIKPYENIKGSRKSTSVSGHNMTVKGELKPIGEISETIIKSLQDKQEVDSKLIMDHGMVIRSQGERIDKLEDRVNKLEDQVNKLEDQVNKQYIHRDVEKFIIAIQDLNHAVELEKNLNSTFKRLMFRLRTERFSWFHYINEYDIDVVKNLKYRRVYERLKSIQPEIKQRLELDCGAPGLIDNITQVIEKDYKKFTEVIDMSAMDYLENKMFIEYWWSR